MAIGIVQPAIGAMSSSSSCACGMCFTRTPAASRFDDLVQALKDALGPSSGLTSDDVDVEHLTRLMKEYNSQEREWVRFAFADESRGYTRNLVDEGNGKSNLVRPAQPLTQTKHGP